MEWFDILKEETSEAESPTSFITWAGLASISAIARRNVYVKKRIYTLYPNLYILIVGPSGVRKGFPVDVCKSLVSTLNVTRTLDGQNSIQGIITTLSKAYTKDRSIPLVDSHALLVSEEFTNLVLDDPKGLSTLTAWFDTHSQNSWTKRLKSDAEVVLKNVCITLFGATNESHFRDRIGMKDFEGGFIARTLCVYETMPSKINPLIRDNGQSLEVEVNYARLCERLRTISTLTGRMTFTDGAADLYEPWYKKFMEEKHPWDRTGTTRRLHDNVLKVAMCLSLSRRDDLIIDEHDMQRAMNLCLPLMRNPEIILRGRGRSDIADLLQKFMDIILEKGDYKVARSEILSSYFNDFNVSTLDSVVDQAVQGKMIKKSVIGDELVLEVTKETIELHKKILRGEIS